jgi:hypothetical protein
MSRLVLAVFAVLGLSELAPARAQFVVGPFYPSGYGYSYRSGFGFAVGGKHAKVKGFAGGFVTRSAFVAPPVFGFAPVGFGAFDPFWGGWGPAFGPYGPFGAPAVAVPVPVPVPVPVGIGGDFPDPNAPPLAKNVPLPRDDGLFPRGEFLVIAPKKIDPLAQVEPIPLPLPLPKPPGPKVVFDPFKVPAPVAAEKPEADPKLESARLVKLGRASFAAGDYGRAAEHFARAANADPDDARTYFLHAQAKFAGGQYAAAVVRIREGLARDPKWPASKFDPVELYGDKPERFVLHLLALKKTLAENLGEATLEFLLGYELWFGGDKAEADKLFRAAEKRLPAPGPIALFKLP